MHTQPYRFQTNLQEQQQIEPDKVKYIPHGSETYNILLGELFKCTRGYWIGYDENNLPSENNLTSGYCPEGYCNQSSNFSYRLLSIASHKILN